MTIVVTLNGNTRIRTDICECHLCFAFFNPSLCPPFNSSKKISNYPFHSLLCLFHYFCHATTAQFPTPCTQKKYIEENFLVHITTPLIYILLCIIILFVPPFISIEWHVLQVWRNLCVSFNLITQFPFFPSLQSNDTFLSFSILYIVCKVLCCVLYFVL